MESYSKVEKLLEILRILRHNFGYFTAEQISNAPAIYQLQNREVIHLLRETSRFRVNDLLTELNTNFLQANQKKYFFLIYGQKINEAHDHLLYILAQPIPPDHPALVLLIGLMKQFIDEALKTIQYYNDLIQDSENVPHNQTANYGAHFHRKPLTKNEPARITQLMIAAHLVPDTTRPEDTQYIFYGLGVPVSSPPQITWLKTAAELSYFVETYFASSDARNKWKTAAEVFTDTQNHHFNQNTLKQRLFNYTSKVKLSTFDTIDTLLLPLLQPPDI